MLLLMQAHIGLAVEEARAAPNETADRADILIFVRVPRSVLMDQFEFSFEIIAPDDTRQSGGLYYDPVVGVTGFAFGYATGEWKTVRTSGDLHAEDPYQNSTYPYFRFADVIYDGTWIVNIDRGYYGEFPADIPSLPAHPGLQTNPCAFFGFSEPDGTLLVFSGDPFYETPDSWGDKGVAEGSITTPYWDRYSVERFDGDTCT